MYKIGLNHYVIFHFPLLQWNSMETCDFVRDKLTEWDLSELIQRFEGKVLCYSSAFVGTYMYIDI